MPTTLEASNSLNRNDTQEAAHFLSLNQLFAKKYAMCFIVQPRNADSFFQLLRDLVG